MNKTISESVPIRTGNENMPSSLNISCIDPSSIVGSPDFSLLSPTLDDNQSMKFIYSTMESVKEQIIREQYLPKKKRFKPSPDQIAILLEAFEKDPLPSANDRIDLSRRTGMSPRCIQVWFQNRRAKLKNLNERSRRDKDDPLFQFEETLKRFDKEYMSKINEKARPQPPRDEAKMTPSMQELYNSVALQSLYIDPYMAPTMPTPLQSPMNHILSLETILTGSPSIPNAVLSPTISTNTLLSPTIPPNSLPNSSESEFRKPTAQEILSFLDI
jgi:hypothetical protein